MNIPDAPWIQEAQTFGTDYMYDWLYGQDDEEEEDGD